MRVFGLLVKALSYFLYCISCIAIVSIMFLTVLDVILRKVGTPIDFAFEVVCILAGVVIAFALPQTSLTLGHVCVEFLKTRIPKKWMKAVNVFTRCIGIGIFVIIGWNAIRLGNHLLEAGQYSPILKIPEFPLAYGLGLCCFVECLVLFYMLLDNFEEKPA